MITQLIPMWYREAFHYNPIPTVYCTIWMLIFAISLGYAARMLPEERVKYDESSYDRGDVVGAGLVLGFFWGLFPLITVCVWLWTGFEYGMRFTRPRPPKQVTRPAVLGILTPTKDPYMEYGLAEVDKIVSSHDLDALAERSGRAPMDFVRVVYRDIERDGSCILYEEPSMFSGDMYDREKVWPEMRNPHFREAVSKVLATGEFSPPDDLDEWTFYMRPPKKPEFPPNISLLR